jgi:hypothetical protein
MRNHQAEEALTRMVRAQEALEISRGAQLRAIAHGLIQDNVGRNRRVINVQNFYSALVQALMAARAQAQADCLGEDVLTLT